MNKYNIYAGLSFTSLDYLFTTFCKDDREALDIAINEACDIYELSIDFYGLWSYEDSLESYCEGISECSLNKKDYELIRSNYYCSREPYLRYNAILTSEDDIDEEDLILKLTTDGSSS